MVRTNDSLSLRDHLENNYAPDEFGVWQPVAPVGQGKAASPAPFGPYTVHPAAELFPLLEQDDLMALAEDIRVNGLDLPVILDKTGTILLDGRNRWLACQMIGIECPTRCYTGDDPIRLIMSLNLKRRHLTAGQMAFVGLEVAQLYADEAKEQISEARRTAVAQRADRHERTAQAAAERDALPKDQFGIPWDAIPTPSQQRAFREKEQDDNRVYFVVNGDGALVNIEVGFVEDRVWPDGAKQRLLGSIPGGITIEHALHSRFRNHRQLGKCFAYEPIKDAIAALLQKCSGCTFVTTADVAEPVDTLAKTAATVGVSRRTIAQAKRVQSHPDLVEKVKLGNAPGGISLDQAERIVRSRKADKQPKPDVPPPAPQPPPQPAPTPDPKPQPASEDVAAKLTPEPADQVVAEAPVAANTASLGAANHAAAGSGQAEKVRPDNDATALLNLIVSTINSIDPTEWAAKCGPADLTKIDTAIAALQRLQYYCLSAHAKGGSGRDMSMN